MCRKAARLGRKKNITVEDYKQEMCSHIGWLKHCNGINLLKKILRYKVAIYYFISSNSFHKYSLSLCNITILIIV